MIISQPAIDCLLLATNDVAGRAGAVGGAARRFWRRSGEADNAVGAIRPPAPPRPPFAIPLPEPSFLAEPRPEREAVAAARPA
jgi:hypothetical protein